MNKDRVVVRRKHTNTTFSIERGSLALDVTLDPYGGNAKLLAFISLTTLDVERLRDLCNRFLGDEND